MSPGKHPPERAQNGTLTPAIGRAAASHGVHALDKTPHDGEKQIQTQDPPNHPPDHFTSSLSGDSPLTFRGFPITEYEPTGIH